MSLNLEMRKIDEIVKNKATIILMDGNSYTGIGDCLIYLPVNDDAEEEEEFLRFVVDGKDDLYVTDDDISEYRIIK